MLNIAVIGCGIAGPAAALFLKKSGAQVTVFDKVSQLVPVGAGFLLQPAGLHILSKLDLVRPLLEKGVPIHGLHGRNHNNKVVLDLKYRDLVPHHMGLGLHRAVLYEELFKAMQSQGIVIKNPCEITRIDNQPHQVTLFDREGHHYGPYDCVVLADGSRSTLRQALTITTRVKPYEWGALWAIGEDEDDRFKHTLEQVYHQTEIMAGMLPMGYRNNRRLISFFWSLKRDQFSQWQNTPLIRWKEQVVTLWPQLAAFLKQFTRHDQFALASYLDVRMYPWHEKRVVVIGDAAHGMSPQLGQGANLGLIDASVLAQCLVQDDVPDALARYSRERRPQLRFYQSASRFVTPWFQSSHPLMGRLRDALHGPFCKTPLLKQQMLLTLACMKTGYFSSTPLQAFPPLE
ncbi:kynurenine 3-monooxygenase [Legionella rubrilucens]|uniref:Kynurenine 3-monooxygenase n=1 Tax=Legionella rubrilucens TaxID=458 RepID=A0A0W0XWK9_9GAMM|nr:NAD(P)/FAD-dependent oxidoreductase [Legionella rubrilucens]KTD49064.1 kynurenine 3-monooxygenase [Legionella rubrilucens]